MQNVQMDVRRMSIFPISSKGKKYRRLELLLGLRRVTLEMMNTINQHQQNDNN